MNNYSAVQMMRLQGPRIRLKTPAKQRARNKAQSETFKTPGGRRKYKTRGDKKTPTRYGKFAETVSTYRINGVTIYG